MAESYGLIHRVSDATKLLSNYALKRMLTITYVMLLLIALLLLVLILIALRFAAVQH
jgi:uncharacterized BrkB/YihY/UPF0761 family membrane protein